MTNRIEFYWRDKRVGVIESAMVPPVKALISIRGETWRVARVTYALDHADGPLSERVMRANIDLKPWKDTIY
jgi:hypothetical protein